MLRALRIGLFASVALTTTVSAARLRMDDKASQWPGLSMADKIDFTDRMGRSFKALSPKLDNAYFMRCLDDVANVGDTKDLRLEDMVKACISLLKDEGE